MAAWWSTGLLLAGGGRFHSANLRKSILPPPKKVRWLTTFHEIRAFIGSEDSLQLGELLRWRPFPFVRRLTGLCEFFLVVEGIWWGAETLGDIFSEVLEIDNLTSQKFQSNMGRFYGSSGYTWRVKDGRFWSHVKYAKDNCWEFQKVERCRSNSTFNTYHGAATKTWTFWKFNENLLKCYTGRR